MLREQTLHHIEEERKNVLPAARKLLDDVQLDALGQEMFALVSELEDKGDPRKAIPSETAEAAQEQVRNARRERRPLRVRGCKVLSGLPRVHCLLEAALTGERLSQ